MRKPNFFIIGAPKCGTTALSQYLSEHHDICFSRPKEPHYFCTDFPKYRLVNSDKEYLNEYFGHCSDNNKMLGEGSVWYLFSQDAVRNILEFNPAARFIVMVRNPVDMAYALHSQAVFSGDEDIDDFETAWYLQDIRAKGMNIPGNCREPKFLQYASSCKLGDQVEKLFKLAPKEQCHLIILDDFAKNPKKIYEETLSFLNLPTDNREAFPKVNANKTYKYKILANVVHTVSHTFIANNHIARKIGRYVRALNTTMKPRPDLGHEMKTTLINTFRDDIEKLSNLINRDLSDWSKV